MEDEAKKPADTSSDEVELDGGESSDEAASERSEPEEELASRADEPDVEAAPEAEAEAEEADLVQDEVEDNADVEVDEETLAEIEAAESRLRELREDKVEAAAEPDRRIWALPVILAVFGIIIYNLPSWSAGETMDERLTRRSAAYCKYDPPPGCEKLVAARAEMCLGLKGVSGDSEAFGKCMMEQFPDYYVRISDNLPK